MQAIKNNRKNKVTNGLVIEHMGQGENMKKENLKVTVGEEKSTIGANSKKMNKQKDKVISDFDRLINEHKEYQSAYDKKVRAAIETAKEKWEAEQKERNLQIGDCLWKVIQYIILLLDSPKHCIVI